MAGTVTTAMTKIISGGNDDYVTEKHAVTWLSDASGDATLSMVLHGFLIKVVTDPGTAAPTANYDITIVADGVDMVGGLLANRHTTTSEMVYPVITGATTPVFLAGAHTFTVANAGNAKDGICYLYIRKG